MRSKMHRLGFIGGREKEICSNMMKNHLVRLYEFVLDWLDRFPIINLITYYFL